MEIPPITIPGVVCWVDHPVSKSRMRFLGSIYLNAVQVGFLEDLEDDSSNLNPAGFTVPFTCVDTFVMHHGRFRKDRFELFYTNGPVVDNQSQSRHSITFASKESSLGLLAIIVAYMKATAKQRISTLKKFIAEESEPSVKHLALIQPGEKNTILLCEPTEIESSAVSLDFAQRELQRELAAWPRLVASCEAHVYKYMTADVILHGNLRGSLVPLILYKADAQEAVRRSAPSS